MVNTTYLMVNADAHEKTPKDYQMAHELFEKKFFTNAKQHFESTRQLAKRIGVSHTTVARKLKKYDLL